MDEKVREDMAEIRNWQHAHGLEDALHFQKLGGSVEEIQKDIATIKDNHLAHIEPAVQTMQADMKWVKWLTMGQTAGLGTIVVAVIIFALTHSQ